MKTVSRLLLFAWALGLISLSSVRAESPATNVPAATPTPDGEKIKQAVHLMQGHKFDDAVAALNDAIRINPQNQVPYFLRASIAISRNQWPSAEQDLVVAESLTPDDVDIEMLLGDVFLMEKKYSDARKRFGSLTHDSNRGDLAAYKVFVCDALNGRTDDAAKELTLFDQSPTKLSCYYAHATRAFIDGKEDEAHRWLDSARVLYAPPVIAPYTQCLRTLGYLPAPKAKP